MKKRISLILAMILVLSCISLTPASAAGAKTLELLTDPVFDGAPYLSDGLALAYKDGNPMYIDADGKTVISYETLRSMLISAGRTEAGIADLEFFPFRNGVALARTYGASIYFDKTGKMVIGLDDYGYSFSEEYATVFTPEYGTINLINKKGEQIATKNYVSEAYDKDGSDYGYSYGPYVRDGLLCIWQYDADGEELLCGGYLNTKLEIAIPLKFDNVRPFNNGLAFAAMDGKWGVINTKGEFVIEPQFDNFLVNNSDYDYTTFPEGYAAVEKDGKWGYIDKTGKTVVPFTYDCSFDDSVNRVFHFSDGLALVRQGNKSGYIDTAGSTVIPLTYDNANYMNGGIALVGTDGKYKLIDKTGATVSNQEWTFESTNANLSSPGFIVYKQNGKWGIAKVVDSAAGPEQPSVWAVAEVTRATELGLVPDGFTSGYTLPMTRGNFCALGVQLYETITGEEIAGRETFSDTSDVNVQKLASLGIVNGVGGGKFNPTESLTREQAATIIARLVEKLGLDAEPSAPDFTDNALFGDWSYDAIGLVQSLGIMNGTGAGAFDPKVSYSLQECILTMVRTYDCLQK